MLIGKIFEEELEKVCMEKSARKLTQQPKRSIFIAQIFEDNEIEDRKDKSKDKKKKTSMLSLSPNYLEGRKESKFSKSFFLSNMFGEADYEKGEKVKSKKSIVLPVPNIQIEEGITKEPLKRTSNIISSTFVANIVDENGIVKDVNKNNDDVEMPERMSRSGSNSSIITNSCLAPGTDIYGENGQGNQIFLASIGVRVFLA